MYATPDSFLSLMIACPDRRQLRFSYAAEAQPRALEGSADDSADALLQMVACADCRQVRFPGHGHEGLALAGASSGFPRRLGHRLRAASHRGETSAGRPIDVALDLNEAHVFDPETGVAIRA